MNTNFSFAVAGGVLTTVIKFSILGDAMASLGAGCVAFVLTLAACYAIDGLRK
jgi:hypothetical protein